MSEASHTHSLRAPNAAPIEFVLWLVWCVLRPVVSGMESVSMPTRRALVAFVLVLIAINLAWLAS